MPWGGENDSLWLEDDAWTSYQGDDRAANQVLAVGEEMGGNGSGEGNGGDTLMELSQDWALMVPRLSEERSPGTDETEAEAETEIEAVAAAARHGLKKAKTMATTTTSSSRRSKRTAATLKVSKPSKRRRRHPSGSRDNVTITGAGAGTGAEAGTGATAAAAVAALGVVPTLSPPSPTELSPETSMSMGGGVGWLASALASTRKQSDQRVTRQSSETRHKLVHGIMLPLMRTMSRAQSKQRAIALQRRHETVAAVDQRYAQQLKDFKKREMNLMTRLKGLSSEAETTRVAINTAGKLILRNTVIFIPPFFLTLLLLLLLVSIHTTSLRAPYLLFNSNFGFFFF